MATTKSKVLETVKPGQYDMKSVITGPAPIALAGTNPLYIADQHGLIMKYYSDTGKTEKFTDLSPVMIKLKSDYEERGLLDMILTQDETRMFVYYTNKFNVNELCEINMKTQVATVLLRMDHEASVHNGGKIAIDMYGYLYLSTGDGGPQKDPNNRAQDLNTLSGKILRIDVSKPGKYTIPGNNPFVNLKDVRHEIYAYGLRNPWGLSFDGRHGRGFVTDAGFNDREEVNALIKGANYGWNIKEGTKFTDFGQRSNKPMVFTDPLYEYETGKFPALKLTRKPSVIIGGFPLNDDTYLFADISGIIMRIDMKGNLVRINDISTLHENTKYIKTFCRDNNGNIYIITSDSMGPDGKGAIYSLKILN